MGGGASKKTRVQPVNTAAERPEPAPSAPARTSASLVSDVSFVAGVPLPAAACGEMRMA